METIKNYIIGGLIILIIYVGVVLGITSQSLKDTDNKYQKAMSNYKAAVNTNRVYRLSIEDLQNSTDKRDSVVLKTIVKEKIKIKKVVETIYQTDTVSKIDTIKIGKNISDTCFKDKWRTLKVKMIDSSLVIKSSFKNEIVGIIYTKRETVKPPSKFFLFRWFQKKHTVIEAVVKNNNPYSSGEEFKITKIE